MIKNIKSFFLLFAVLAFSAGCYKSHDEVVPQGQDSGSVRVTKINSGFFNLLNIANASTSFDLETSPNSKAITNVEVQASLNSIQSSDFKTVQTLTTLPGQVSLTAQEVATAFGVDVSSFKLGDIVRFRFKTNFSDGSSAFSAASVAVPFSCPSSLAGTYNSFTSGTSTDGCSTCGELMDFPSTVTITKVSDGVYKISDFSAGAYLEWYAQYGITPAIDLSATIRDVCNVISFNPFNEPFGTAIVASGSVDSSTGNITYTWKNGYDDTATVTLVKQ